MPTYAPFVLDKFWWPSTTADVNGDGRADLIEVDGWASSYHIIPSIPGPTVQLQLLEKPIVGSKGTLIVNLSLPANGSTVVQLSASDPNIVLPATVTVPNGSLSVNVPFTIGPSFNSSRVFALNATLGGQTATIYSYQTTASFAGFRLSSDFQKEEVPPTGTTSDYGISLFSIGGYSTTVQFSCLGLPTGASCQPGSSSLALPAGQSLRNSLTVQTSATTPLGTYSIQLVASDGAVTDQLPLRLVVADFSVSASPSFVTVVEGTSANLNVTIQGTPGWSNLVGTACVVSPQVPNGLSCDGGSYLPGTYSVSVSTNNVAPTDFTIQFSGSADGVTHEAAPITLHVQNAVGTVSPTTATIPVGSSVPFNVNVTSQNGLTDQFTFSCPGLPMGVTCSFSPASGTLAPNGTLASTLTITVNSKPAAIPSAPPRITPYLLRHVFFAQIAAFFIVLLLLARGYRDTQRVTGRPAYGFTFALFLAVLVAGVGACSGGGGGGPPPPPPTVTLQATPASINKGNSTTLTWSSSNATQLSILPGVGSVAAEGSTTVTPSSSITYTISANGPGGSASANATVTVVQTAVISITVQASSPSVAVIPGYVTITIP